MGGRNKKMKKIIRVVGKGKGMKNKAEKDDKKNIRKKLDDMEV